MTKVVIHPEGVRDLKKELDRFTGKITDECVEEAKSIVPVKTGALRDSIEAIKLSEGNYQFGSDKDYAFIIEFGSATRAPQSYLRAALPIVKQNNGG